MYTQFSSWPGNFVSSHLLSHWFGHSPNFEKSLVPHMDLSYPHTNVHIQFFYAIILLLKEFEKEYLLFVPTWRAVANT